MGKKVSCFSAIKGVCFCNSKEKQTNESEKTTSKENKRHGQTSSFIPLFKEPSSIEKILGDADEQKLFVRPPSHVEQQKTPSLLIPETASPEAASPPRAPSPKAVCPEATSSIIFRPPSHVEQQKTPSLLIPETASPEAASPPRAPSPKAVCPEATSSIVVRPPSHVEQQKTPSLLIPETASPEASSPPRAPSPKAVCPEATSSIVGHRPEPTLRDRHLSATKIQAAYRGYAARRSVGGSKGLVRLQGVLRGEHVKRQTTNAMKATQLFSRVQTQIQSLRIQTLETRALQRQAQTTNKEFECSLSKRTVQSEAGQHEEWDDSLLLEEEKKARLHRRVDAIVGRERAMVYACSHQLWNACPKSARPGLMDAQSGGFPWWWNWLDRQLPLIDSSDRQSVKSFQPTPSRPNLQSISPMKYYSRPRTTSSSVADSALRLPFNDNDSLVSCPPFSVRNYMAPTISTKAKARARSNPRERFPGTPSSDSNRRYSHPLTPNVGSYSKWNRGFGKDEQQALHKVEESSIDSPTSMSAIVGRKPFNRFV